MKSLQVKLSDGVDSKSISFAEGSSDVTVAQLRTFAESYNGIYQTAFDLAKAVHYPDNPGTQIYPED